MVSRRHDGHDWSLVAPSSRKTGEVERAIRGDGSLELKEIDRLEFKENAYFLQTDVPRLLWR
jgi:hypothetical protein